MKTSCRPACWEPASRISVAGSHEDWRTDQGDVPAEALGNPLDNWPGERWLDVRRDDVRELMEQRLDRAVETRCDGVEPDNVDGYANDNGFGLTPEDQLDFNRFLAREAHPRDLSVGLKNDLDQIDELVDDFDWSLNEECHANGECEALTPFVEAGKAVFHAEYVDESQLDEVCAETVPLRISTILKNNELDAWRVACPGFNAGLSGRMSFRTAGIVVRRFGARSGSSRRDAAGRLDHTFGEWSHLVPHNGRRRANVSARPRRYLRCPANNHPDTAPSPYHFGVFCSAPGVAQRLTRTARQAPTQVIMRFDT